MNNNIHFRSPFSMQYIKKFEIDLFQMVIDLIYDYISNQYPV